MDKTSLLVWMQLGNHWNEELVTSTALETSKHSRSSAIYNAFSFGVVIADLFIDYNL